MPTRDEMFTALRAADAAGATEDAQRIAQMIASAPAAPPPEPKANPAEGMSATERFMTGVGGQAARLRDRIFPPASPVEAMTMSQTTDNGRARKDDLAVYERNRDALGTAGTAGEVVGDIALSAGPLGKAGNVAGKVLSKALGRMAPAAGDIAVNAGYAGLTADPENRGSAALAGGAGAAGGRLLVRALGGAAKPFVSQSAQALREAGVTLTPGQLFDGPAGKFVRGMEDRATSIPFVGDVIQHARGRSMAQYGNAEINAAMKPLGVRVEGAGAEAVEQAQRAVSGAYDKVLPQVYILPTVAKHAVQDAQKSIKNIALIDGEQQARIGGFIMKRIAPVIEDASSKGGHIDGQAAKALDAEIGHYAREFSKSPNPGDHPMGEAFYELQASLRGALYGNTPDAIKLLRDANTAYRNLLPVVKAADRTAAGNFTPRQLNRASNQYGQTPSALNRAGQDVLPSTVPDSGTAGRVAINSLAGVGSMATGTAGHLAGAAGVAAILYSRPGMALFIDGLGAVVPKEAGAAIQKLKAMAPEGQRAAIEAFMKEAPEVGAKLAAQVGRALATQQGQQ